MVPNLPLPDAENFADRLLSLDPRVYALALLDYLREREKVAPVGNYMVHSAFVFGPRLNDLAFLDGVRVLLQSVGLEPRLVSRDIEGGMDANDPSIQKGLHPGG